MRRAIKCLGLYLNANLHPDSKSVDALNSLPDWLLNCVDALKIYQWWHNVVVMLPAVVAEASVHTLNNFMFLADLAQRRCKRVYVDQVIFCSRVTNKMYR